jgi:hypothetical protein
MAFSQGKRHGTVPVPLYTNLRTAEGHSGFAAMFFGDGIMVALRARISRFWRQA